MFKYVILFSKISMALCVWVISINMNKRHSSRSSLGDRLIVSAKIHTMRRQFVFSDALGGLNISMEYSVKKCDVDTVRMFGTPVFLIFFTSLLIQRTIY